MLEAAQRITSLILRTMEYKYLPKPTSAIDSSMRRQLVCLHFLEYTNKPSIQRSELFEAKTPNAAPLRGKAWDMESIPIHGCQDCGETEVARPMGNPQLNAR